MLKVNIKTNTEHYNSVMVVNKSLLLLVNKLEDRSSQNNYKDKLIDRNTIQKVKCDIKYISMRWGEVKCGVSKDS